MVNTYGLAATLVENASPDAILSLYTCTGNESRREWKKRPDKAGSSGSGPGLRIVTPGRARATLVDHVLPAQIHYELADFDDHLNDVAANDWRNVALTAKLVKIISELDDSEEGDHRVTGEILTTTTATTQGDIHEGPEDSDKNLEQDTSDDEAEEGDEVTAQTDSESGVD